MSDAIACDLGRRAEPFLLTKTSVGSVSEYNLTSSNRQSLRPVKSSRGRESRVFIDSSREAWTFTHFANLSIAVELIEDLG